MDERKSAYPREDLREHFRLKEPRILDGVNSLRRHLNKVEEVNLAPVTTSFYDRVCEAVSSVLQHVDDLEFEFEELASELEVEPSTAVEVMIAHSVCDLVANQFEVESDSFFDH